MDEAYEEAVRRLGKNVCGDARELYFIIIEIDQGGGRRQWEFDRKKTIFHIETPF